MDFSKLDELVKMPKKSDASREKRQEYFNEMVALLLAEGYSQQAEQYLFEGFSLCAVSPILAYMEGKNREERLEIYDKVVKGEIFRGNDKCIAFKVSVCLLAQMINNYPDDLTIVGLLIRDIPGKSQNKEGKINGDAPKVIEKYFVCDLNEDAVLPDFFSLNLTPGSILAFCKLFSSILTDMPSTKCAPMTLEKVRKWVSVEPPQKASSGNEQKNAIKNPATDTLQVNEGAMSNKPLKRRELIDFAELLRQTESRIAATASHMDSLEKGMNTLNSKLSSAYNEIELLKRDQTVLSEKLAGKSAENEKLLADNARLNIQLSRLGFELESKKSAIADMTAEIDKLNSVISVFSADKQNSQSEQLNAIASKLKAEYRDFLDALEMEMTIDLGENLKQQISTIFKVLARSGINVEGR